MNDYIKIKNDYFDRSLEKNLTKEDKKKYKLFLKEYQTIYLMVF